MNENPPRQRQSQIKNDGNKTEKSRKKNKYAVVHDELHQATSSVTHRNWTRVVIAISVIIIACVYTIHQNRETKFATVRENLELRVQKFECSEKFKRDIEYFPSCVPRKCGRFVIDKLLEDREVAILLDMAKNIIGVVGSSSGASILDIHTGALSYGEKHLNFYKMPEIKNLLREEHLTVYNEVKRKIKSAISKHFGIVIGSLFLTYPTFFSRLTNIPAKNIHDEYWHEHVDKETYPAFHYTSLLYLTTFNKDFNGGRFVFVDGVEKNRTTSTIEPKRGRVIAFTSGHENRHYVEKVTEGARFAITISFSCNREMQINDPQMVKLNE